MDMTNLMLSMLFGTIGMGFFMHGKKMAEVVPMLVGVMLMVCPYFISNASGPSWKLPCPLNPRKRSGNGCRISWTSKSNFADPS